MFILFFFFSIYSALADERIYSSPYFIDGLHCQGLAEHVGWETLFISQEEAEAQRQLEAQEDCTELFKVFGLEKYTWMSPEELERVSAQVSQSVYFQEAQLSIKKSDLKNHIHILLNVKTKSKYVYRFGIQEKVYSLTENSRFFQRLSGELLDRSLQPNTSDIWGFNLDLGGAARDVESQPLYNKNFYFVEFYYKHQRTVGQAWTWSMVGRVNADNALIGRSFEGSLSIDNELLYSKYLRFIHGSIFGGVAAIFTPDFGYFASLYLNQNTSSYDTPISCLDSKWAISLVKALGLTFERKLRVIVLFTGPKPCLIGSPRCNLIWGGAIC